MPTTQPLGSNNSVQTTTLPPDLTSTTMGPLTAPTMQQLPPGLRLGSAIPAPSRSTLPSVPPPVSTNPITPAPHPTRSPASAPISFTSPIFGGGWTQYATAPGSVQNSLAQLFSQGVYGQAAVDALNQNPSTSGVAYYADKGMYGLPNGYYIAPNASGSLDLIQWAAGDNGQASSAPDLTGMLTQLLSGFKAPTNNLAATPAPTAPNLAPTTRSSGLIDPSTGLPFGISINPVTGTIINNPTGAAPTLPIRPLSADTGGSLTTRSVGTPAAAPPTPTDDPGNPIPGGGSVDPNTGAYTPPPFVSNGGNPQPTPSGPPDLASVFAAEGLQPPQPGANSATPGSSTSGNPFTDPTQMQLWNQVMAVLNQANQPVGQNPQTQALYAAINNIAQQLSGPVFTDQQLNNIRTASMDSIQRDQDNAIQAEIQRQGLLGQSPTSGTVTDAVTKIKASYDTLRGQAQQANNIYELNTVDQRRQELLQALNLGATTATNNTQLGFNNAVTGAQISTLPVSAENTALQNALSVTNAASPVPLLQTILQLIQTNDANGQVNGQNNAALAVQLGNLLSGLL